GGLADAAAPEDPRDGQLVCVGELGEPRQLASAADERLARAQARPGPRAARRRSLPLPPVRPRPPPRLRHTGNVARALGACRQPACSRAAACCLQAAERTAVALALR